jgi:thiamine kinase-like enzyme
VDQYKSTAEKNYEDEEMLFLHNSFTHENILFTQTELLSAFFDWDVTLITTYIVKTDTHVPTCTHK